MAVSALLETLVVEVAGAVVRGRFRYTRGWARETDGQWRVAAGHVSKAADTDAG